LKNKIKINTHFIFWCLKNIIKIKIKKIRNKKTFFLNIKNKIKIIRKLFFYILKNKIKINKLNSK